MPKLIHYADDSFDVLGGKGMQALVTIGDDGAFEVIGRPQTVSKNRVSGESLDNVRHVLSRIDPEDLAAHARAAKKYGSVKF